MPRGTSLLSSKRSFGATVVHGAIPTSSFVRTINFFHVNVPKASFKITYSESEPPRDAEGEYESKRYKGRWTLESIAGCKGAVRFEATAAPSS